MNMPQNTVVLLILLLWGCTEPIGLSIWAASSLTEVLPKVAPQGAELSFGASSRLARQIQEGATPDIFISASPEWLDRIPKVHSRRTLAMNRLVIARAKGVPAPRSAEDFGQSIAIAGPFVPAGHYARQALKHRGLLKDIETHLVNMQNARATARAIRNADVDSAIIYATDCHAPLSCYPFEESEHAPIVYEAVALNGNAQTQEAIRVMSASAIWQTEGFKMAPAK